MHPFSFRCANGDIVDVEAPDEPQARSKAMELRWGLAILNKTWSCDRWEGKGLMLIEAPRA